VVISKVNPVLLKSVTEETGGKYFNASNDDVYSLSVKTVRSLGKNNSEVGMYGKRQKRFSESR
jgi:hypothetical protein